MYTQDTLDPKLVQFSMPDSFPHHVKILLPKCCETDYKKRYSIKDVIAELTAGVLMFCIVFSG